MPHYVPFRYPNEIKVYRTASSLSPDRTEDLFQLDIRYTESGDLQHCANVHIPKAVQYAFDEGLVKGLHLEYLPFNGIQNSAVSQSLRGGPVWVVLGVERSDGERIPCVPKGLLKLFRTRLISAVCLCAGGAALSQTTYSWVGGVLFAYGVCCLMSAFKVPRKPDWPSRLPA